MLFSFNWTGKLVSFNRYLKARAIKLQGKWIATVYASKEYKDLVKSLNQFVLLEWIETIGKEMITEKVDIIIKVSRWKIADTDNIIKPIGDSLQQCGVIKNDNLIRHRMIFRSYHKRDELDNLTVMVFDTNDNQFIEEIKRCYV